MNHGYLFAINQYENQFEVRVTRAQIISWASGTSKAFSLHRSDCECSVNVGVVPIELLRCRVEATSETGCLGYCTLYILEKSDF